MLDEIEERLRQLEETVGVGEDRALGLSIAELKNTFAKKGCNRVLKIDAEKLKKLKEFVEKPESRPLSEKINYVQSCADITRKRAELLQEFEERLKVVLNTDDLAGIQEYEKQVEPTVKDIHAALHEHKQITAEIEEFSTEYTTMMLFLHEQIQELAEKVARVEAKKRHQESSEA